MADIKHHKKIEDWKELWDKNSLVFHKPDVHKMLEKHYLSLNQEVKEQRLFIPLCGKTVDMKWLFDLGHTVVGVEAVKKGLIDFFTEYSLQCIEEDVPSLGKDCKVLKAENDKLRLYFTDIMFFNKSVERQFDCIWDRGSLVALNREDVNKYVALMKDLLKPNGKMLVETIEYDLALFEGQKRPFADPVFEEEVRSLYEPDCTVMKIDGDQRILKGHEAKLSYYLIVKN